MMRNKKPTKWTKYVSVDKRKSSDEIYIPYDPDDKQLVRERQSLIVDFELAGWTYKDSTRVPDFHRNDYRFFWILEKK